MGARIVTLQGDSGRLYRVNLRGVLSPQDYTAWNRARYITGDDVSYLDRRYPELLGVWGTVAVGAGKILKAIGGKVFKRIAERVRQRRAAGGGVDTVSAPAASVAPAQSAVKKVFPDSRAKAATIDINKFLPVIGIGAIVLFMAMKK